MNQSLQTTWEKVLALLEEETSSVGFKTWIKPIVPIELTQHKLSLSVENQLIKNMIEGPYNDLIQNAMAEVTGTQYEIEAVVGLTAQQPSKKEPPQNRSEKFTFDNFIVGNSNRFAQAACLAVAETPALAYNPLFLYGGVGLGKTHLMHAIKNYIKQQNPNAQIAYLSAETFTNELIYAIQTNSNQEFRNKYRNMDVLLVDDIQFIAGKTSTEEEFFHTFNTLHEANKQIVLTSDRPPKEIKVLEERLRSRFEWGLVCDIQPPDYETRIAILKQKAASEGILIQEDVYAYVADKIKSNIRELEGVFNRIVAYSGLESRSITLDLAIDTLKNYGDSNTRQITPEYIVESCARYYNVTAEEIYSNKRTKNIAFARQVAIYIIRTITSMSLEKIGNFFERDHSTIIHTMKKIENDLQEDESIRSNIQSLIRDIKGESSAQ